MRQGQDMIARDGMREGRTTSSEIRQRALVVNQGVSMLLWDHRSKKGQHRRLRPDEREGRMDDHGLELFTGRARYELSVTLQRGGRFIFNQAVADLMGDPPTVELLFDRNTQQMAIRPATPDSAFAYPLRRHQRPSTRLISGRKFMTHYGISRDVTRRYKATWDGALLLVDLTHPSGVDDRDTAPPHPMSDGPDAPSISSQEPANARHTRVS